MVECRDGLARITSEELTITHPAKDGILLNACSTRTRMVAVFGEKCSFAHRQVDEQPTKRSKTNNGKSAVAMKKYELHDRTGQPIADRETGHESNHGLVGCSSSNARHLACVFQDMEPPKVFIRGVKFTKADASHADIRDQNPSLGMLFSV